MKSLWVLDYCYTFCIKVLQKKCVLFCLTYLSKPKDSQFTVKYSSGDMNSIQKHEIITFKNVITYHCQ